MILIQIRWWIKRILIPDYLYHQWHLFHHELLYEKNTFETKSLTWGQSIFFSDKNQYSREYHGPIDIEKITIRLYDDKGNIMSLNGQDWSMTLISQHLYKY